MYVCIYTYIYIYVCIYIYIYACIYININMTKCQYQKCKRVLNTRVERIKKNGNKIKSTHISY